MALKPPHAKRSMQRIAFQVVDPFAASPLYALNFFSISLVVVLVGFLPLDVPKNPAFRILAVLLVGEGEEIGVDVACWGRVGGEEDGRKDDGGKDCGPEGEAGEVEFKVEAGKEKFIAVDEGEEE